MARLRMLKAIQIPLSVKGEKRKGENSVLFLISIRYSVVCRKKPTKTIIEKRKKTANK